MNFDLSDKKLNSTRVLPPILMDMQMKVAVQDAGCVSNQIKRLVGEFQGLYEHRLRCLEQDASGNQTVLLQVSSHAVVGKCL